jgi:hypothetical protein
LWIEGEDFTEPEEDQGEDLQGWETFSVKELKEELRGLDLPVSGTKDELIARLEEYENSEEEQQ